MKHIKILYYKIFNYLKNLIFNVYFIIYKSSTENKFNFIYKKSYWGKNKENIFYSGIGSHKTEIIEPYIKATINFLNSIGNNFVIVDLGCGDFNIGKEIVPYSSKYIACDIVSDLIIHNQKVFGYFNNVEFHKINIITDSIPIGDICIIREVFQHLSNKDINNVILKLSHFKYIIFTEHLPYDPFKENADHTSGFDTRLSKGSGVVLTKPPFNLIFKKEEILCKVDVGNGNVLSYIYTI